jgi:hypothetical protein
MYQVFRLNYLCLIRPYEVYGAQYLCFIYKKIETIFIHKSFHDLALWLICFADCFNRFARESA